MLRKILKNTPKTKKYLDSLPKIYGIFLWAKWGVLELPWTGKYSKGPNKVPLVYNYYDANGTCDEYHLVPITYCSSGAFWDWYEFKNNAEHIQAILNEALKKEKLVMTNLEKIRNMDIDTLAKWLDENGMFDNSPWSQWFSKTYCDKCEGIKCSYEDSKEKLGITPFYDDCTIECSYCELYGKCRFFEEHEDIPDNYETIKMWLNKEAE